MLESEPRVEPEPTEPTQRAERATLAQAERAYEAGNFTAVRTLTGSLLSTRDSELGRQAKALRQRVSVDPVALIVLAFALLLFCAIVVIYVL